MVNKYRFTRKNPKTKKIENTGYMEIRNAAAGAELYIYGDIVSSSWDVWSADDTCPQDIADFMNQIDQNADLTVYINSGGGDVFAGIAIHSILSRHTGHIKGVVDGLAASIASVILMACDEIVMSTGAQIMIHKPSVFAYGNTDDLTALIAELDKCQQSITDIYMQHAKEGVSESDITDKINAETWMSAQDAQEVFDIEIDERPAMAACVSWMMDSWKNAPKNIRTERPEDVENREAEEEADLIAEMELMGI